MFSDKFDFPDTAPNFWIGRQWLKLPKPAMAGAMFPDSHDVDLKFPQACVNAIVFRELAGPCRLRKKVFSMIWQR